MTTGTPSLRVLMLCTGNICRSPTAEAMLRHLAGQAGCAEQVEVDSAGTHDYHLGEPPDRRSIAHGRRRGLALESLRARLLVPADLARFDLVLAMDRDHLAHAQAMARRQGGQTRAQIGLLLDYADEPDAHEVPDPYYGEAADFERVIDLVELGCAGVLSRWRRGALQQPGPQSRQKR